jgi:SAM-dependent methyltransferase
MSDHDTPAAVESERYAENIESFSSDGLLTHYTDRADVGLFPEEVEIVERYFTDRGARLLDVGCGTGRTTGPLAAAGFDVLGVDVSDAMVERARGIFPDVDFQVADATDLPYEDDTFQYALFSHNGLDYVHPVAERRNALRELRRVLAPDGYLAFSTHNAWYRFPALLGDHDFLRQFYLANGNPKRLFRRYKVDVLADGPLATYLSNPVKQRRQLRTCGFDPVALVGKRDSALKNFEAMLYFVARPA